MISERAGLCAAYTACIQRLPNTSDCESIEKDVKNMFGANAMFSANDIYSLTDFQRNAKDHVDRLTKTKRPEVLTVKGKAQVVVQDARAYEQIVEELETIKKVNAAAAAFDRGEGRPVQEFFDEFEKKHELAGEKIQD